MTIKELADELGVSKQAIRKHLEKLPPTLSVTKKENAIYLDTDVTAFVRSKVTRLPTTLLVRLPVTNLMKKLKPI